MRFHLHRVRSRRSFGLLHLRRAKSRLSFHFRRLHFRRRRGPGLAGALLVLTVWAVTACGPDPQAILQAQEVTASAQAAQRAQAKLEGALASPEGATVSLTSEEVTSLLDRQVAGQSPSGAVSVQGVAVLFRDSRALLSVRLSRPLSMTLLLGGEVGTRERALKIDLRTGRLGPAPLPGFLLDRLERSLNDRLAGQPLPEPIREVRIEGDHLVLTLKGAAALIDESLTGDVSLQPVTLPELGLTLGLPADHQIRRSGGQLRVLMAGGLVWLEIQSMTTGSRDAATYLTHYLGQLLEDPVWALIRGPFEIPAGGRGALAAELSFETGQQSGDLLYVVVPLEDRLVVFGGGPAAVSSRANRRLIERILDSARFEP